MYNVFFNMHTYKKLYIKNYHLYKNAYLLEYLCKFYYPFEDNYFLESFATNNETIVFNADY